MVNGALMTTFVCLNFRPDIPTRVTVVTMTLITMNEDVVTWHCRRKSAKSVNPEAREIRGESMKPGDAITAAKNCYADGATVYMDLFFFARKETLSSSLRCRVRRKVTQQCQVRRGVPSSRSPLESVGLDHEFVVRSKRALSKWWVNAFALRSEINPVRS